MKKSFLKFVGGAMCLSALFVNFNLGINENSRNVTLLDLSNAIEANAECISTSINNGRCSTFTGNCYFNSDVNLVNCDTTAPRT